MLKAIKLWWNAATVKWESNRIARIQHQLERDSASVINLMEFEGCVYIAYNGIPIVSTAYMEPKHLAIDVLKYARQTWIDYRLKEMDIENK